MIALVANTSRAATGTTGAIDTTGATLLTACVARTSTAVTLSDSKGNRWALVKSINYATTAYIDVYVAVAPIVGASHTFTLAGGYPSVCVAAFSGVSAQDMGLLPSATDGSATSLQPGSITSNYNNSLLVSFLAYRDTASLSVNAGFTITNQHAFDTGVSVGIGMAYLIQAGSPSAVNPTWSWTGAGDCAAANASYVGTGARGGGEVAMPFVG